MNSIVWVLSRVDHDTTLILGILVNESVALRAATYFHVERFEYHYGDERLYYGDDLEDDEYQDVLDEVTRAKIEREQEEVYDYNHDY